MNGPALLEFLEFKISIHNKITFQFTLFSNNKNLLPTRLTNLSYLTHSHTHRKYQVYQPQFPTHSPMCMFVRHIHANTHVHKLLQNLTYNKTNLFNKSSMYQWSTDCSMVNIHLLRYLLCAFQPPQLHLSRLLGGIQGLLGLAVGSSGRICSRSQDNSRGYKCWTARSMLPFPVFNIAPRTMPSLPMISCFTTANFQRFLLFSDYNNLSNLWVGRLLSSCSTMPLTEAANVFPTPSIPHNSFTLLEKLGTFLKIFVC